MITLWHNPRCSKSRAALKLLEEAGADVTVRTYLTDPPNRAEIDATLMRLGLPVSAMMRRGEAVFKDLQLAKVDDDEALLDAMAEHPILIERPIAIRDDRAVIGRPPEDVLALLE